MSYLNFNKEELVNLEYSLLREMLNTNRAGGYTSTTIVGCNTRKYHGLLVCPVEEFGGENHVLLSSLDETVVQHDQAFNLGIHRYPGVYEPRGHKYIIDFSYEPTPTIVYRVGGVVLKKEIMLARNDAQFLVRYTLLDAHSPTLLRLKPMLAFRSIHQLSKVNMSANTQFKSIDNGISSKMYEGYPDLHMQLNKKNEFVANPDWFYNVEYLDEQERGYDYREDLFAPGYFEMTIKKGESIVFSASLKQAASNTLLKHFDTELALRPPKDSFLNCLKNTASQFMMKRGKEMKVVAGYPWYGCLSRDTFMSLPGLTLSENNDPTLFKAVMDTMSATLKDGLFPVDVNSEHFIYSDVDTPLWYFWAIQKYVKAIGSSVSAWKDYGKKMKSILAAYRDGLNPGITLHENGLIWAEECGKTQTWMNAMVAGKLVIPRCGYMVEVNALWYNAICFLLELAKEHKDTKFIKEWGHLPQKIEESFIPVFWLGDLRYLSDYIDRKGKSISIRPNQLIATSLPYSPIPDEIKETVLNAVAVDLLTPKGIRTLSPKNPRYRGVYEGSQEKRDEAAHQGTVWVWLLGHYVEANFRLHGKTFVSAAEAIVASFEEEMTSYGICCIPEVYDGDPPHSPGGAISQAWSVAEILRIFTMIREYQ